MKPFAHIRPAGAFIAVLAIALAGLMVAPVSAADAAPKAWTCTVDTFVWRTGGLNQAVVTAGIPTPTTGPLLVPSPASVTMTNLNAIARHPITGVVYANEVGARVGSNARVINPDGTVEDVSAAVPLTNETTTGYAGGTFTNDGYWLLADASGNFATVDLTNPLSPTYGTVVYQGVIRNTAGGVVSRWLSGDMAYRASDDRVYFTTWNADGFNTQVGSIPRSSFFGTADIVPNFGPTVTVPGAASTSGAASGFDSAGNLWMSTNLTTVPAQQSLWRLDSAALTGIAPIIPANPVKLLIGTGTDGFMCFAPPAPATADPALAATGKAPEVMSIVGGVAALLLGAAMIIFAGARRRRQT